MQNVWKANYNISSRLTKFLSFLVFTWNNREQPSSDYSLEFTLENEWKMSTLSNIYFLDGHLHSEINI